MLKRRLIWGVVALAAIVLLPQVAYVYGTQKTFTAYVTKTERDQGNKFIWLDGEPGMLRNDDSLLALKRDSGTLHGKIPDKTECKFRTYGWRVPWLFSLAPNVLDVECKRE